MPTKPISLSWVSGFNNVYRWNLIFYLLDWSFSTFILLFHCVAVLTSPYLCPSNLNEYFIRNKFLFLQNNAFRPLIKRVLHLRFTNRNHVLTRGKLTNSYFLINVLLRFKNLKIHVLGSNGLCSSTGRAMDCGSRGYGFESRHEPVNFYYILKFESALMVTL